MLKGLSIMFLSYIFTSGLLAAQAQTTVVAESFNLRYDTPNDGINAWPKRQHMVLTHLQTLLPDVVGMQEVLAHQLEWLDHNLPDYAYIGVGRDDGLSKGEFVPLLYNKNQLTKIAGGNFWLSETPAVAGSIGWQAQLPRVVSWGHFKKNDKEFFVFNAHFSHVSDLARQKSAEFLMSYIPTIAHDKPVILLGDLNTLDTEIAYKTLVKTSSSVLAFSDVATKSEGKFVATFNGYGHGEVKRIDYILTSKGLHSEDYHTYQITADGLYISDHFPISAVITLAE